MKRIIFILTVVLSPCLKAPAPTYIITITGNSSYVLLGSQFSDTEMSSTYVPTTPCTPGHHCPPPYDGDAVATWDVGIQDFSPIMPQYSSFTGGWAPDVALPRGQGFFYIDNGPDFMITKTFAATAPLSPVTLSPGVFYALSSQTPNIASYGDLVGNPSAVPNPVGQTFVFPWDVFTQDFDPPYHYSLAASPPGWQPSAPSIPLGLAAFVVWYSPTPPPSIQSAQLSSPLCPPNTTLDVTFSTPVDPAAAAQTTSYAIYDALTGGNIVGIVTSATANLTGTLLKTVTTATLAVSLLSQSGNTYYLDASGVTSLGGSAVASRVAFSLGCSSPPNDDASGAVFLTSGTVVHGSLGCAAPSPAGAATLFPPNTDTAKDVWYAFIPSASGSVTIDTCEALQSSCPQSATAIAVYQGNPSAGPLEPIPVSGTPWYGLPGSYPSSCGINSYAAQVTFPVQTCNIYYIRASGENSGDLPGDFSLLLVHTPLAPANDACAGKQVVSANSSTPFDNLLATTDGAATEGVFDDLWFYFYAPAGSGPWPTTVDTCTANWGSALAVYTDNGNCPPLHSDLVAFDNSACPSAGQVTFSATANQGYYVRVGGANAGAKGCGFVRVASGIPAIVPTVPSGSPVNCAIYELLGLPNNIPWSWSFTAPAPCNLNVQGAVGGVSSGGTALDIANAFAASINTFSPNLSAVAAQPNASVPGAATLTICSPCGAAGVVLKVGPSGTPACWVDFLGLTVAVPPCSFNPAIYEKGDPNGLNIDCNHNGHADFLDILTGVSTDWNGNGIPDECEGCVRVAVANGPISANAYLGGPATFVVNAVGSGPFYYQWRKGGAPLLGQTNATLVFTNLTLNAADLYDVIVSNACSTATSGHAALAVHPQPWLNFDRTGANVVLWWSAPNYHLQASPALDNTASWSDLTNASPVTLSLDNQTSFFRLAAPGK